LPISIIMGDLNGLKIINDSYGQKMGDKLLIKTAEMLKELVRADDILARYGGDEFTILLPKTSNKIAQKIVKRIKNKSREQNVDEISLSISLGKATKVEKNQKITEIIKSAEDNLYQNKLSESRSSKSNIVQGLLNTLNAKSSETKEHAVRMTKLAFDFGEKLGLSNSKLNRLSLLATLHDIGKTSISEKILKKPAKLTDAEWELIKEHPERGAKIAAASEEFAAITDEILYHHEKWDGSGYPDGLEREEIPYLARIITIIDSYDVMTNDRPYSKAMSREEALKEIKNCAGSQFDPQLAENFIALIKSY
ncbi:MAG: HD-GYP domain-containing protein, partial [Halanaerobium sp.]